MRLPRWSPLLVLAVASCDDTYANKPVVKPAPSVAPKPSASAAPADAAPRATVINVDDRGCTIDSQAFAGLPNEWEPRAASALEKKPDIAGHAVPLTVAPATRPPKVLAILSALEHAKATSAVVTSSVLPPPVSPPHAGVAPAAAADASPSSVQLSFAPGELPACTVVAAVRHDMSIDVKSRGGARIAHMPRGSQDARALARLRETIRGKSGSCDSRGWVLELSHTVPWAFAFELISGLEAADGGLPGKQVFLEPLPDDTPPPDPSAAASGGPAPSGRPAPAPGK